MSGPDVTAADVFGGENAKGAPKLSQATQLVALAKEDGIELWHTPAGDPFATINVDGHREHQPLVRVVRDYLARRFYIEYERAVSSQALTDATATLTGMARYDGAEHPVAVRVASQHDALYLDLGTSDWQVVEISASGWRLTGRPPVRYWRPKSLRSLPVPVAGGALDALRELWPNITDEAWNLITCWLVGAIMPSGPYPILILVGEQGSGKSTLGRMLRGLLDPASPSLRGVPRDERDVVIGASTNHMVVLDNLSGAAAWLSDALCRVATGSGFASRQLYTDSDEITIDVCRPILLTGIDSPASRGDLLDRALVVTLPAMSDEARGDEATLWQRYDVLRPRLLGALLDVAVTALGRRDQVSLPRRPRMADACTWVTAAEPALGWPDGAALAAWMGARDTASADLLANDVVAAAVVEFMATSETWTGTCKALLAALDARATEGNRRAQSWPKSPRKLSSDLARLAPDLRRAAGVNVLLPAHARTGRERTITIARREVQKTGQTGHTGQTDENRRESADSACPISCPISPTGPDIGQTSDTKNPNESELLSDVSDVSDVSHTQSTWEDIA